MPITVTCPQCGKKLNAPDSAAGKQARCPACKTTMTLPNPAAAPPPLPEPEEVFDAESVSQPVGAGVGAPGLPEADDPSDPYALKDDFPVKAPAGAPAVDARPAGPPRRPCPMCGEMIPMNAVQCRFCHEIFDPKLKKSNVTRGSVQATSTSSSAIWALVCGIAGFFLCGLILGIAAINLGNKAKKEIDASRGEIGGSGLATAGIVLGVIDLVAWALLIVARVALRSSDL
jgi:hypothetical protein